MDRIGERIEFLRNQLGLKQADFAEALGISRGYVASVETGAKIPSKLLSKAIAREFFVREEWLEKGEEPMRPSSNIFLGKCISIYGLHPTVETLKRLLSAEDMDEEMREELNQLLLKLDELELHEMLSWLTETYRHADVRKRTWLSVQFERAFPEFKEDLQKKQHGYPSGHSEAASLDTA